LRTNAVRLISNVWLVSRIQVKSQFNSSLVLVQHYRNGIISSLGIFLRVYMITVISASKVLLLREYKVRQ